MIIMDDVVVRPAYPRHSLPNRRRKKCVKEKKQLLTTLRLQLIVAIMVIMAAGAVKSINSPITNYITDRIRITLTEEMDISGIRNWMSGIISNLENGRTTDNDTENTAVPVSADIFAPEDFDEAKIDYGGIIEDNDEQPGDDSNVLEESDESNNEMEISSNTNNKLETSNSNRQNENTSDTTNNNTDSNNDSTAKTVALAVPVSGVIGSPFGERVHPTKGVEKFHYGIDIKANSGVPIKAALDGEVIEATYEVTYGNFVKVKHSDGLSTLYAHCSVLTVKKGQKVKKGQVIARVGSTGDSTGPHLHFEVHKNGTHVDPLTYIKVPAK